MSVGNRNERGAVLIAVLLMWVVVSLIIAGMLAEVSEDLRGLSQQKDILRARYAADGGAAVILALLADGRGAEIGAAGRFITLGGGSAFVRQVALTAEGRAYLSTGRAGRAQVSVDLVVGKDPPYRVLSWTVRP